MTVHPHPHEQPLHDHQLPYLSFLAIEGIQMHDELVHCNENRYHESLLFLILVHVLYLFLFDPQSFDHESG